MRTSMSSISIALAAWLRMLSATRARVEALKRLRHLRAVLFRFRQIMLDALAFKTRERWTRWRFWTIL